MSPAHFHLLVNHFPLIGTVFGSILLIAGFLFKKEDFKIAAYGLFVVTALLTIPAYLSGEPAEEAVEHLLPQTDEALIEEHEEMAGFAIWLIEALGVLAAAALVLAIRKNALASTLSAATVILALIVLGVMAKVNNTGGKIRHPEIRNSAAIALPNTAGKPGQEDNDAD